MVDTVGARSTVRFLLGWEPIEVSVNNTHQTLLQYLRSSAHLTGTKEGCAEGDCGACSVIVAESRNGDMSYRVVNACVLFLPSMDGKQILTIEHMDVGGLHPLQSAMAELHGAQCGFCTPGIVMSLIAHQLNGGSVNRRDIDDALAGNLCRCTGYGPIIDAAVAAMDNPGSVEWQSALKASQAQLNTWAGDDQSLSIGTDNGRFEAPRSTAELCTLLEIHSDTTIVAGATDVGLWVTKHGRQLRTMVSLGAVRDINDITETDDGVEIGAGVTYTEAHSALGDLSSSLGEMVRRIGATQVRNSGTICGNIANGSPIGDMPPALIALGATLELTSSVGTRDMPLEDFFIDYGKQDRRDNEFVSSVRIPRPRGIFSCYKISKRFDQDISAVLGAFHIEIKKGKIDTARIAFGGMAATPKRAIACEEALSGVDWSMETIELAQSALDQDFTPLSDARASQNYRSTIARNLLERFYLESLNPSYSLALADRHVLGTNHG
jgi:xanthine dehydrogenase small subunit